MTWSDIPGRAAYTWIYDEWIASSPRQDAIVVEVGVALGKSIAYLVDALDLARRHDVQVYAVDPWGGYARNGEQQLLAGPAGGDFTLYARQMLEHAPQAFERVRPIRTTSVHASLLFRSLHGEGGRADLVIIDGAHDDKSIVEDLACWREALHWPNGWIGGDDHEKAYPAIERAVTHAFGRPGEGYEVRREQDWGTWLKRPKP